jgi:histidyl-tRNA synthetase
VPFEADPALVRGLDYYTHTAFEFVTTHIGAQGTVLGGGRYDGLIAELGGPPTAGIGWAGGIERLMMLCNEPTPQPRPVMIAPLGAAAEARALGIARDLRRQDIAVAQDYRGSMKRRMQRANKLNARAAIIIGDDELARGVAQLKDLDSGEQREVALDRLTAALKG